ncbi:MAG: 50S ribosomal protein L13 [Candidatus Woykebacteria bacterium]
MVQATQETKIKKEAKSKTVERDWLLIDAKNKVLGRLSTRIAIFLMGKHKPNWQPYLDVGDNVIVLNAAKVSVTGKKGKQKEYFRYSGYPGGLKRETFEKLQNRKPEEIIRHAVAGMLPKNKLGAAMIKKLFIYPREAHPHEAQKPKELEV